MTSGLCRILFLNDTETANIIVLHVYFDILINFIRVGKSKNMLEFFFLIQIHLDDIDILLMNILP